MIKRTLSLVSILIAVFFTNAVYAHETIKSASEYDYPPYSIVTEKGEAGGFSVELLRASLKAVGVNVEFYVGPWIKIKQDLAQGKIQVLPVVGRTPEREKIYDFSVPYKTNYGGIFVRTDQTSINTLKDLADKEILVMKGDNSEEFLLRENVSKHIIRTESFEDAFNLLSKGKHDAVVVLEIVGTQLIERLGITNVISISRIDTYKQDFTFAVKEGDTKLLTILNDGLSLIITNGTFDIIHDKWFGLPNLKMKIIEKEPFSYAKKAIKQKAEDVARQVEIYLSAYPDKTLKDLQNDPKFQKIAIQPVGETGYTAVSDHNNLVILFHPNKDLIGRKFEGMSKDYPVMWGLLEQAKGGHDVSGKYEFPDLDGAIKDKYVYIKTVKKKPADGVGLWVAATAYLDEYDKIGPPEKKKESLLVFPMIWVLGILIVVVLLLLIFNKLKIIKFEKNAIMLVLSMALILIIGLFIFNAYNITKNLKKSAIENYYDTLRATASSKHVNIKQHITHIKSAFKVLSSRKAISNEDLMKIVKLGEDFSAVFIIGANGKITHSSNISHIGFSRSTDPSFKNLKEGLFIKPLYPSETMGEVSFTISVPYNEGVLVARQNLNHIHEIISKKEGLGETGESLLAYRDKNGDAVFFTQRRFTAEAEARDIIPKEDINIPITQALLKNEREFWNYVDYRGAPVFAVTKYIDEIDAGLVVKIDQEEALKSVSRNINQIWYSTTVIILAIIIIGIIFYFLLTYSLRREVKTKTKELVESEEKIRNIFDNSTIVHYSHGVDQIVTYVSPHIKNILGYTPEEAKVKWKNFVSDHPMNKTALENTMNAIETGERQSAHELELIHKNGKKVCVEVYEAPVVKNGKTISIIGSFTDITLRKRAEDKIARFGRIFEDSLNEIYLFDMVTFKFVQVNPAAMHNLGYTMEELKKLTALDITPEISAESIAKIIAPLIKEEKQRVVFKTVHKRKNRSLYNVEVHLQLLKHEYKSLFAAIVLDITDQKLAQEEKTQLEKKYRQSQKMESIGTLAGGIAHDFNNILYPIIGFTEMSMEDLPKTHEVQENLQDILDGAKRARDLVKQILLFARQEKQRLKPIVLKPVVEEAMKLLRSTIPANIDIQSHLYDGEDYVLCDATEIHEIVMNLCTNAYHSMEEDGGTIIIRLNKKKPSPYLNLPSGEYICLRVHDNGIGIPKEIIDKIFEPYLTTKELGKGSGLGLSVVHGIVTNYKGNISVESSPGKGSIFDVFLPVTTPLKKVEQKLIKEKPPGGTENILFVDDEASIVKLATRVLERMGYTITGKTSCTEALELFKNKPDKFDLVITDMAMPIMTGTELTKNLLKIRPDIPIIMCSGFSEKVDFEMAKSIGIKEYIKKPILTDELISKIREVLNQSRKNETD